MKTHFCRLVIGTSALVLAVAGGVSCKTQAQSQPQSPPPQAMDNPPDTSQSPADVLPPDIAANVALADVIRMSQASVSEEVMSNYVNSSQSRFNLTPSQIIYLRDIGVPDSVVLAMLNRDQQLGGSTVSTPPPQAAPAPPPTTTVVTEDYFYDSLAPYGTWVYVEGYGRCWRPSVVAYNREWRPYCDGGHWVYTDNGWYWFSDYSWGWAPFHYGRWFFDSRFGWCWWPDTVWGPSWVTWRYSDDYCGWAPLPPHCYYREGVGLVYNGVTVSVGFDFGFGFAAFTFVDAHHFCDPHPWRYRASQTQVTQIYNHTTVNNITIINNGNNNTTVVNNGGHTTVVNHGPPPDHIAAVTHTPIHPVHIRETTTPVRRGEMVDRSSGELVVTRPHFDSTQSPHMTEHGPHTIPSPTTGAPMQVPPPGQAGNNHQPNDNVPRHDVPPGHMNAPSSPNANGNDNNPQRGGSPAFGRPWPRAQGNTETANPTPSQQPQIGNPGVNTTPNENGNNGRPNRERLVPITQTPANDNNRWNQRPAVSQEPRAAAPVQPARTPEENQNNYPHNQPARNPAWDRPDVNEQPQRVVPAEPQPRAEVPRAQPENPGRNYSSPRSEPPQQQQPVYVQPQPQPSQDQGQGQGQGRGRDRDKNNQ